MRCAGSSVWTGRTTRPERMAPTLRELVAARSNDYSELERRYRALTGGELVCPPCESGASEPPRLTRSAIPVWVSRNPERLRSDAKNASYVSTVKRSVKYDMPKVYGTTCGHHQCGATSDKWMRRHTNRASFQKRREACLLEVMVAGESVANPFVLHGHERNTIGERPLLVRTFLK